MATVQFATRVDEKEAERFRETARALGTTPADALRMFVASFNACGGFPYDVRLRTPEPFSTEEEAMGFAERMLSEVSREER